MPAVGEQHAREREIFVGGLYQPAGAMLVRRRFAPLAGRGLVRDDERAGLAAIGLRQSVDLAGGTKNAVSFIQSGPKMRSSKRRDNGWLDALATNTPWMS